MPRRRNDQSVDREQGRSPTLTDGAHRRGRWRAVRWGLGGSLVFVAVIGATITVQLLEGRAVVELPRTEAAP